MEYLETISKDKLEKLTIINNALKEIAVYEKLLNQFGINIVVDDKEINLDNEIKYSSKYQAKIDLMMDNA
jgi:hypothetical protein